MKISNEKRNRIIQASLDEFNEFGYTNASTNRIVKKLEISKGSLFKYFATKKDLYVYLAKYATDKLLNSIDGKEIDKKTWREVMIAYAGAEFDFLIEFPREYKFFFNLVQEIEKESMADIKHDITIKSHEYYLKIIKSTGLDITSDNILINHIGYVLRGYNNDFIIQLDKEQLSNKAKAKYIAGLKKHLSLIGAFYE